MCTNYNDNKSGDRQLIQLLESELKSADDRFLDIRTQLLQALTDNAKLLEYVQYIEDQMCFYKNKLLFADRKTEIEACQSPLPAINDIDANSSPKQTIDHTENNNSMENEQQMNIKETKAEIVADECQYQSTVKFTLDIGSSDSEISCNENKNDESGYCSLYKGMMKMPAKIIDTIDAEFNDEQLQTAAESISKIVFSSANEQWSIIANNNSDGSRASLHSPIEYENEEEEIAMDENKQIKDDENSESKSENIINSENMINSVKWTFKQFQQLLTSDQSLAEKTFESLQLLIFHLSLFILFDH